MQNYSDRVRIEQGQNNSGHLAKTEFNNCLMIRCIYFLALKFLSLKWMRNGHLQSLSMKSDSQIWSVGYGLAYSVSQSQFSHEMFGALG